MSCVHVDPLVNLPPPAKTNTNWRVNDPNRTRFELQLNSDLAILLDQHTVGERLADGPRTLKGRLANAVPLVVSKRTEEPRRQHRSG